MFFSVFSKTMAAGPRGVLVDDAVQFDCERMLAGIRYHLIEEGIADEVDAESIRQMKAALGQDLQASIPRERWELMRNLDRLHWLLHHAGVVVTLSQEGVAILRERRSWLAMLPLL